MTEPPRAESESSNEHGIEEEDALLTGQRTGRPALARIAGPSRSKWREIGLFVWAVIATAAVVVLAVVYQHSRAEERSIGTSGKRNLIFMVSDGMGPTSLALTRSWMQFTQPTRKDRNLFLDDFLIGQSRTRSSSSLITDSAAGATAFSCGAKSYNGAISILPDFTPCGSVMEAAKRKGYTTGLVVTTRITDATPAVFASHARRRVLEDSIARQMIGETHPLGRVVDLMMGGGQCHFLPNSTGIGCRHDELNVIDSAKKSGWTYVDNKAQFDASTKVELPFMALFAPTDMPYEIDRIHETDVYPSLEEMAKKALHSLAAATKDKDQGFFIMIEGSRIDHAGHANDPAAQVHEVLAYDRAMNTVVDFIHQHEKETGTPTLMVSTSDHETGGLAVAKQLTSEYPEYHWFPSVLANVTHSASYASHQYHQHLRDSTADLYLQANRNKMRDYLSALSKEQLGIYDCGEEELDELINHPITAAYAFADMVSRRAQTGWSTHGHSGADVNIYASDHTAAKDLVGNHENTDVGVFLRRYLGVEAEVEAITKELNSHATVEWLGDVPDEGERLDGDERAPEHARSPDYNFQDFVNNPDYLSEVVTFDIPLIGDITGLEIVHLQCHIGTDTLSLARRGAKRVVGLDFSSASLKEAQRLAEEAAGGDKLSFVEASVYDAAKVLPPASFDLVFTGVGALCWIPDIRGWAKVVHSLLKPNGRLFIREGHPVIWSMEGEKGSFDHIYPYFERKEATVFDEGGTYATLADPTKEFVTSRTHEWNHGLGEIVQSLIDVGMAITGLVEHRSIPWVPFPGQMVKVESNHNEWELKEGRDRIPLSYTLQAVKVR